MAKRSRAARLVALSEDGRKTLLVKRRHDGRWAFPGGKRNTPRESLRQCLRRELRDEHDTKCLARLSAACCPSN
jgi:ADP-ribose pyrophosphatase YjhB (NUDIX family)